MFSLNDLFEYYSEIQQTTIDWLWYPYIPRGKLTVLQGDPGGGKSTFAIQLAGKLSTGSRLPGERTSRPPINVIYQCAEDNLSDTVKPRLLAAQADCSRMVHIQDADDVLTLEDGRIEETIHATNAGLVIIDPLQAYIGGDGDMMSAVRMRKMLRGLASVAERSGAAILLIGHMNKNGNHKSLYRGLGSIDIAAIARSVLMLIRDEDDPSIRYVVQIKNNLAAEGLAIAFHFTAKGEFAWLKPRHIELAADGNPMPTKDGKLLQAIRYLKKSLNGADRKSSEILASLAEEGISRRTAHDAKTRLGVTAYRKENSWYWHLGN